MSSLASSEKKTLLEIARNAVVCAVEGAGARREVTAGAHAEKLAGSAAGAGAFVTLRTRGRLRGCIGQISPNLPLTEVIAYCARAAALEDPRFAPVRVDELGDVEIEISVLSAPEEIAPDSIRVGEHGLIITQGLLRGVLLPHVATEFRWPAQRFLEETCVKAGLDRDAWKHPETEIQAFTAEVFDEKEMRAASASESARRI
jgi:uncharacterized protein